MHGVVEERLPETAGLQPVRSKAYATTARAERLLTTEAPARL